jgi:cytochrome c oxidase subunit II
LPAAGRQPYRFGDWFQDLPHTALEQEPVVVRKLAPILLERRLAAVVDTQAQYHQVATVYGAIAVVVFVLVVAAIGLMLIRYRARDDGRTPSRVNDAPRLESLYVLALGCIAAFLVAFTFIHEAKTDAALKPHSGLTVRVTAAKWHWTFFYPAYGITELGTNSSQPTLYVPTHTNIDFQLVSIDVIHAFWIPMTRFKRAAYPDFTQYFTLSLDKPGFFLNAGECAEFCGLLHSEMRFNLDVMSMPRFKEWVASQPRAT